MVARRLRLLAAWAAPLALIACASVPSSESPPPQSSTAFEVSGRFSAKHDAEGVAGQFSWAHAGDLDTLTFGSPMGQALARLSGDAHEVRLELPDGTVVVAPDWESLTQRAVGIPLPVRGLAFWVRARPRPGAHHDDERDDNGRLQVLHQDGWEIVYGYSEGQSLPARLRLAYPQVELRIAIDSWH